MHRALRITAFIILSVLVINLAGRPLYAADSWAEYPEEPVWTEEEDTWDDPEYDDYDEAEEDPVYGVPGEEDPVCDSGPEEMPDEYADMTPGAEGGPAAEEQDADADSETAEPPAVYELPEVLTEEAETEEITVLPDRQEADNEELFEKLAEEELYGNAGVSPEPEMQADSMTVSVKRALSAQQGLDPDGQRIYELVVPGLQEIAAGERSLAIFDVTDKDRGLTEMTLTEEELGVPVAIEGEDGGLVINPEAKEILKKTYEPVYKFDLKAVLRAWLSELPYELYWFDKTTGLKGERSMVYRAGGPDPETGSFTTLTIANGLYKLKFRVAEEYSDSTAEDPAYTVDQSSREALDQAKARIQSVVDAYAAWGDYEKLDGYRQEICSLVSYNSSAAADPDVQYGNAFQLIWVFDGDDTTNVVCEGYAKAFQYLFQRSEFESPLTEVKTVNGKTGRAGGVMTNHMWNVVTMEDGRNYLADITNCDTGMSGEDRLLFLCGGEGSPSEGYTCGTKNGNKLYVPDEYSLKLFGDDGLVIPSFSYIHDHISKTVPGSPATCEAAGATDGAVCELCERILTPQEDIPAKGHTWGEWTVKTPATVKNAEVQQRSCSVCNQTETKTVGTKLPAAGLVTDKTSVAAVQQAILAGSTLGNVTYVRLQARAVNAGKYAVRLEWNKVSGAAGYIIYGSKCGYNIKRIGTTANTYSIRDKLTAGSYYQYRVVAYGLNANGTQRALTTSAVVYEATKGGSVTNPGSVTVSKTSLSLKAGKTAALKASVKAVSAALKLKQIRAVRFVSSDPSVAKVTVSGQVTAVKKGSCVIYAYAQNGIAAKVSVKVS